MPASAPAKPAPPLSGRLRRAYGSCERRQQLGVERIELPPGEPLGLDPDRAEVLDDGGAPFAVAQHPDTAAPVVQSEPVDLEHAVQQPPAEDPPASPALLLGPVAVHQHTAEDAHCRCVLPPTARIGSTLHTTSREDSDG